MRCVMRPGMTDGPPASDRVEARDRHATAPAQSAQADGGVSSHIQHEKPQPQRPDQQPHPQSRLCRIYRPQ